MKITRLLLALALLGSAACTYAGNLHILILDFGSKQVDSASLSKNLQRLSLRTIISSRAKLPNSLQNASVLFAQSIPAVRNSSTSSLTTLGNSFSQLNARLDASSIRLNVRLSLAPEFNIGSPSQFIFNASGPLPSGFPVLLSLQEKNTVSKTVLKGIPTVKESKKTRALLAQFDP